MMLQSLISCILVVSHTIPRWIFVLFFLNMIQHVLIAEMCAKKSCYIIHHHRFHWKYSGVNIPSKPMSNLHFVVWVNDRQKVEQKTKCT